MLLRLGSLLFAACLLGCGGGSSLPPADAGADAPSPEGDAAADGDCFPFCGTGADAVAPDAAGDGALSCAQLKARYQMLETARACNPQLPNQCGATTNDPCCPVTVTESNTQAVADFDYAVMQYEAQCTADCSMRICQSAPSLQCDGAGSTGLCR
jgi:hypothetical protein